MDSINLNVAETFLTPDIRQSWAAHGLKLSARFREPHEVVPDEEAITRSVWTKYSHIKQYSIGWLSLNGTWIDIYFAMIRTQTEFYQLQQKFAVWFGTEGLEFGMEMAPEHFLIMLRISDRRFDEIVDLFWTEYRIAVRDVYTLAGINIIHTFRDRGGAIGVDGGPWSGGTGSGGTGGGGTGGGTTNPPTNPDTDECPYCNQPLAACSCLEPTFRLAVSGEPVLGGAYTASVTHFGMNYIVERLVIYVESDRLSNSKDSLHIGTATHYAGFYRAPGTWRFSAMATYTFKGEQMQTPAWDTPQFNIQFPHRDAISSDATVKAAMDSAWSRTISDTNDANSYEYGFYIYIDTRHTNNGYTYDCTHLQSNATPVPDRPSINLGNHTVNEDATRDPKAGGNTMSGCSIPIRMITIDFMVMELEKWDHLLKTKLLHLYMMPLDSYMIMLVTEAMLYRHGSL